MHTGPLTRVTVHSVQQGYGRNTPLLERTSRKVPLHGHNAPTANCLIQLVAMRQQCQQCFTFGQNAPR